MSPLDATGGLVRAWTRLYTWRLPTVARDTRRAEIDSDLWEFANALNGRSGVIPALHVLARLALGAVDDLCWRASHVTVGVMPLRAAITVGVAAIAMLVAWVYAVAAPTPLPTPAPRVRVIEVFPPPPPPPRVVRRESWTIVIHPAPPSSP
jgi:hypothetical protein